MLVLLGDTYVSRLWCIWELYCLFGLSDDWDDAITRVEFLSLSEGNASLALANDLKNFDLSNAHCFNPNDELKIKTRIEIELQNRLKIGQAELVGYSV